MRAGSLVTEAMVGSPSVIRHTATRTLMTSTLLSAGAKAAAAKRRWALSSAEYSAVRP